MEFYQSFDIFEQFYTRFPSIVTTLFFLECFINSCHKGFYGIFQII